MSITQDNNRAPAFRRNTRLEEHLDYLNRLLACSEQAALADCSKEDNDYPLVFIMGPHRSGTTLFMQWLAHTGIVAYPTNLLSRFYGAPVVGAQIQLLLTDPRFNYRNEILDFNSRISYDSENGKTHGALAPNEFWYFWRRFLPFQELDWLDDDELFRVVDRKILVGELTALTQIFEKPFAMKAMILNYNIPFLDKIFKNAVFVRLLRDPVPNIASILEARKRQLGSVNEWYSFKIPEYPKLKELEPITQCAGQLHCINKALSSGMSKVAEARKLEVRYESFCDNPRATFYKLIEKLGLVKDIEYAGPDNFTQSAHLEPNLSKKIRNALSAFESGEYP